MDIPPMAEQPIFPINDTEAGEQIAADGKRPPTALGVHLQQNADEVRNEDLQDGHDRFEKGVGGVRLAGRHAALSWKEQVSAIVFDADLLSASSLHGLAEL